MPTPLHPHEKVALGKKRLLYAAAGLFLVVLLGGMGGVWLWNLRYARKIAAMMAAAEARGEPTTTDALNRFYKAPEGDDDATSLWVAGLKPLIQRDYSTDAQKVPLLASPAIHPAIDPDAAPVNLQAEQAHLQKYTASLENFHAAAALGGEGRMPVDFSPGADTLLPYTQAARDGARLLQLDLTLKAKSGDARGVAKSLATLLVMSRSIENEPAIVSQMVAMAIERVGVNSLATALGHFEFTDDELARFEAILRARNGSQRNERGLIGERIFALSMYERPESMGNVRPVMILPADLAAYLEHIDRLLAASKLEFPDSLIAAKKAQNELETSTTGSMAALTSAFSRALNRDFRTRTFSAAATTEAKNRAALAAIAIERYRRKTQKTPAALAELVPEYLAAEPIDPFTGKPMLYKADAGGLRIYSAGENGVDDGGIDLEEAEPGVFVPLRSPRR